MFRFSQNCAVLVVMKASTGSIINVFQNKSECEIHLGGTSGFITYMIFFPLNGELMKIEVKCSDWIPTVFRFPAQSQPEKSDRKKTEFSLMAAFVDVSCNKSPHQWWFPSSAVHAECFYVVIEHQGRETPPSQKLLMYVSCTRKIGYFSAIWFLKVIGIVVENLGHSVH